ncbi:protein kinase [Cognatiyoonia sp. IB215446]|uniref:serine/threonine protein kinase n=1 Tax=Cognatiyoonia sp. IB215446 TaxID=3097355 RepID=UPI002A16226E|nr:protein kinase [Cognatiyoonia sp. IB215446]MDX8346856.1 protein kinase [Cognatiyoonia sp. IB215446]
MASGSPVDVDPDFSEELPTGTTLLSGQYTIDSYLNHGGFGITYLATDSLDRQVVIKECFPGTLCRRSRLAVQARSRAHVKDLQGVVRLFVKEAQSLSKLVHPNIVGVHQVFEDHGTAYMALDYVRGSDLLSYIESPEKRLSPAQITTLLEKVLDAVRFVHDAGLLHRDISPDNIILTEALEPILIDFGAAREQATKATQALSALRVVKDGYSPQEFYLAGSTQAPSSDLYSLAATFYHLIAGEVPPDSQVRITSHVAEQTDPYVPLGQKTKDFDATFCAAIDRALAILPQDRLQSATEWKQLLQVKPAEAKAAPVASETPAPTRKKKTSRQTKPQAVAISRPRRAAKPKQSASRHIPALLMGGAAVLVLVGGSYLTPDDVAPASPVTTAAYQTNADPMPQVITTPIAALPASGETVPTAEITAPSPVAIIDPTTLDTSWADGLIELNWRADLPFTIGPNAVVTAGTAAVPSGAQIMAIDGITVQTRAEVEAGIAAVAGRSDGTIATVSVTWIGPDDGNEMITELPFKIIYHTAFDNGLAFETRFDDEAWITKVVNAPATLGIELQVGDEIVALVPDNKRIIGGASLAEITSKALMDDRGDLQFAVRRNDALWIADLGVADEQS